MHFNTPKVQHSMESVAYWKALKYNKIGGEVKA